MKNRESHNADNEIPEGRRGGDVGDGTASRQHETRDVGTFAGILGLRRPEPEAVRITPGMGRWVVRTRRSDARRNGIHGVFIPGPPSGVIQNDEEGRPHWAGRIAKNLF